MRRTHPARGAAFAALALTMCSALLGADKPKKKPEPPPPKVEETIGTLATIITGEIRVEGVGLVIGLDNTGSNPPPSEMRKELLNNMRKAGVEHPEHWLERPTCSMVVVKATLPNGIAKIDPLDVEIELPPGSGTTGLVGGRLLMTELAPVMMTAKGEEKKDHDLAVAGGPIMIGDKADANNPKVGRVLGGGRVKKDIPYNLVIKDERRSVKSAKLIEDIVGLRFSESIGGDKKSMATPTRSDSLLILKVPKAYHHNQARYFQVVQNLSLIDTPNLRAQRMQAWGKDLLDPKKAGKAALKLEGIGTNAIPNLKDGLASPDPQVKFFAAEALAYLGDVDGATVLADAAKARPELRSYALKALAAMDQSAGLMRLRDLMGRPEIELRYGAFDALRSFDESDPFLGRVRLAEEPRDPDADDPLALQIDDRPRRRRAPARDEPFKLFLIDCDGPPLVHISRTFRAEVVVFGRGQKLLTPVVLGAGGAILLNAGERDNRVEISRITHDTLDQPDSRISAPLDIVEVVRAATRVGATYPEVVAILDGAARQKNLPGPLVVDAIPLPSKSYSELQLLGVAGGDKPKKDDALKKTGGEETKKPRLLGRIRDLFDR